MELSGLKMLPEQEVQAGGVHLRRLTLQASTASNGYAVREYACPMRHMYKCKVGLRIIEGQGFMQLEWSALHDKESHVTPPRRSLLGSFEDNNLPPELIDSDEADAEEEDGDDEEDDDSGDDNAHDSVEDAQQSVDEGFSHNILISLFAI